MGVLSIMGLGEGRGVSRCFCFRRSASFSCSHCSAILPQSMAAWLLDLEQEGRALETRILLGFGRRKPFHQSLVRDHLHRKEAALPLLCHSSPKANAHGKHHTEYLLMLSLQATRHHLLLLVTCLCYATSHVLTLAAVAAVGSWRKAGAGPG